MSLEPSSLVRLCTSFPRHRQLVGRVGRVICVHGGSKLIEVRFPSSIHGPAATALVETSQLEVLRDVRTPVSSESPFERTRPQAMLRTRKSVRDE